MKKELTIIIILIIILTSIYFFIPQSPKIQECQIDSDCVKVQTTCCSCNMGGEEKCVSSSEVEFYKEKLKKECVEQMLCPAFFACHINSCVCEKGICTEK